MCGVRLWELHQWGVCCLTRRGSIVSDQVKYEIAKELGFADRIQVDNGSYDYGNITTREAGLIVRGLIQKAEELLSQQG